MVTSKEPLGLVVPHGDEAWFNIVKWVVFATIEAEEREITQDNVADMVGSDNPVIASLLGAEGDWAWDWSRTGWLTSFGRGQHGEIYDRNLGPGTPSTLTRAEQPVDRGRAPDAPRTANRNERLGTMACSAGADPTARP